MRAYFVNKGWHCKKHGLLGNPNLIHSTMPVFLSCDTSCERVFLPDTVAAHSKTAQTMLREKKLNGAILTIELKGIAVETLRLFVADEGIANASRKTLMDVMASTKSLDMQNIIDKVEKELAWLK